ncbi:MAG TPA: S-methyl-5-thioribose-1-phosphate isomerase, partial [Pirellulales bacterium]|nr:S-methyl-5-thioribose-1-phosphate isomerase [Pirellulales bacterium]
MRLIDQTRLPGEMVHLACRDVETLFEAIRSLRVRGAPAIGVAAAYGVCIAAQVDGSPSAVLGNVHAAIERLAESRPTAMNLFWALERMRGVAKEANGSSIAELKQRLLAEARTIHDEDRRTCREIGRLGASL